MPRQKSTHVDSPEAAGARLRLARERAGLSQRQLSFPGCSPAYISRVESGQRIPSLQLLRELGRRLGVSADYLATGAEERSWDPLVEAEIALRLDQVEAAEHLLTELLKDEADPARRGRAQAALGQIALREGEARLAIERLREAVDLLGERAAEQPLLGSTLAKAYAMQGEVESAIALHERMLELARRRGDAIGEAWFAVALANILIDRGNLPRAEELLAGVIRASEGVHDPEALARLYWSQSRLHVAQGAWELASRYAERTLALLELSENTHNAARAHHLLAYIEVERGNPAEALDLLQRGLPLIERAGDRYELAQFRLEEARALLKLGRHEEARELSFAVLQELEGVDEVDCARARAVVAEVLAETGDRPRAIELYETSLAQMGRSPFALDAHRKLADLLEAEGRQADALDVLKRAVALQAEAGSAASAG
jgi:tetratricopeptide (TPR) repeat protein